MESSTGSVGASQSHLREGIGRVLMDREHRQLCQGMQLGRGADNVQPEGRWVQGVQG